MYETWNQTLSSARIATVVMSQCGCRREMLQAFDRDQAGNDTGCAVEVAAVGDGIEMRSRHEARRTSVLACQCHKKIGGMIAACFEPHGLSVRGDQLVRELLARSIGIAGYAFADTATGAQCIKTAATSCFWLTPRSRISEIVGVNVCFPLSISCRGTRKNLARQWRDH